MWFDLEKFKLLPKGVDEVLPLHIEVLHKVFQSDVVDSMPAKIKMISPDSSPHGISVN